MPEPKKGKRIDENTWSDSLGRVWLAINNVIPERVEQVLEDKIKRGKVRIIWNLNFFNPVTDLESFDRELLKWHRKHNNL